MLLVVRLCRKIDLSSITETNDVSEVLENIGKGYEEFEDDNLSGVNENTVSTNWDPFFVDSGG